MAFDRPIHKLSAYYASLAAVGLIVGSLGPALDDLAHRTGSDLRGVSIILVARPLGYLVGALLCGRWLDRVPGHPILAVAALACAGLLAAVPQARTLTVLASVVLVLGFAQSLLDVGSNTLLGWVYGRRIGPYLSGMHFSFGVGAFVAPLLVARSLARQGGSAGAFRLMALLLLPLALWLALVASPPKGSDEGEAPAVRDRRLEALFLALFFCYGGTESGFGSWICPYAVRLGLEGPARAALLASVFWGLLGLGRLAGIPVLARFTPRQFLRVLMPGALGALVFTLLFPVSPRAVLAGAAVMGLFMACIFPTLLVFAAGGLAQGGKLGGRTVGLLFVGSAAGGMVLPWVMGQMFQPLGPRWALSLPVAALAGQMALTAAIARRSPPPQGAWRSADESRTSAA